MHLRDSIWLQDSFFGIITTRLTGDFDEEHTIRSVVEQSVEDAEFLEGVTENEGETSKNTRSTS